jgi:AraC-like DNA-binding protein
VDIVWQDGAFRIAGPDMTAAISFPEPGATFVGARFQPGAARVWLGLPMSEIVNQQVDLADLWGGVAHELARKVEDAATAEEQAAILQSELLRLIRDGQEPAREAAAVFALMRQGNGPGGTMSLLLDRLDASPRTLRRRCHEHFGYGPKTLHRILRFQRLLSTVAKSPRSSLAGMALDVGYADQSHMSRDLRQLTGLSPKAFVRQFAV